MVLLQNSGYSAVESVMQDMSNYGIDVDCPVPEDDSRLVNVPVTSINVDDQGCAACQHQKCCEVIS